MHSSNLFYFFLIKIYFLSLISEGHCSMQLRFKIRPSRRGNKSAVGVHRKTGISLEGCVVECYKRLTCRGLRYFRQSTLCVLNDETTDLSSNWTLLQPGLDTGESCIEIPRDNILATAQNSACSCKKGEICEQTGNDTRCTIKECLPKTTVPNGKIRGNLNNVRSKLKFSCDENFVVSDNDDALECLETGQWNKEPMCIFVCSEPLKGNNVQLSAGSSTEGSTRVYTCSLGFYYYHDTKYVTNLTTECRQEGGDWDFSNISCVKGSKVGESCSQSIPCVGTKSICSDSTCFCHAMYVVDSSVADCVPRCTETGYDFDVYTGTRFNGHNDWTVATNDVNDCLVSCNANPECFHVEDWTTGYRLCYLGRVSFQSMSETKPSDIRYDSHDATIYSRICT